MKNTLEFTSLFNYILNENDSVTIVTMLNKMLEEALINEEIFLNLIKALILIFHLDISYYNIYCQALADGLSTSIKIPERYMKLKQPNEKLFLNVIKKLGKKNKIIVL